METTESFDAFDGKVIQVVKNSRQKTDNILVFIPGLGGEPTSSIPYTAAQYFPRRGVDFWRVSLVGSYKKARRLRTTKWSDHLKDVEQITKIALKRYKNVFLCGHSLGGTLSVMTYNKNLKGKVLWDSSYYTPKEMDKDNQEDVRKESKYKGLTLWNYGSSYLMPIKYLRDFRLASSYPRPVKIGCPSLLLRSSQSKMGWSQENAPVDEIKYIPDSDHCFMLQDGKNLTDLFSATLKFIKKTLCKKPKS